MKIKSAEKYLKKHSLDKTHWGKRIIKAEKCDGFNGVDRLSSNSWFSCACGKLSKRIERDDFNRPKDIILRDLGTNFNNYIHDSDFIEAAKCLKAIEKRECQLLGKK